MLSRSRYLAHGLKPKRGNDALVSKLQARGSAALRSVRSTNGPHHSAAAMGTNTQEQHLLAVVVSGPARRREIAQNLPERINMTDKCGPPPGSE